MRQALAALFGAGFTVAACYATGALFLDKLRAKLSSFERVPLAFALGAACLHLVIFAIFATHLAYKPVLWLLLAMPIVAALVRRTSCSTADVIVSGPARGLAADRGGRPTYVYIMAACAAVFFVLYLVNAWAPEASPDGSGYHLSLIARYLRAHAFERVTTNWYAALGEGIEMLYAPAFSIGRHSAAALVHFAFLTALALAIAAFGRRIGKFWAGAAAAVLVFISPVVGIDGTSAYIDVGTATAAFAAFYFLELWDAERNPRLLIPAGLLAGYTCASKYTAFVLVIYAVAFVAWRSRRALPALVVASCAAVMIAPWIVRSWVWFANPIAPVGNALFRNPYFYVFAEQDWAAWLRHYDVKNRWELPLEVTFRGMQTNGLLGPVFLLAPLALFAL